MYWTSPYMDPPLPRYVQTCSTLTSLYRACLLYKDLLPDMFKRVHYEARMVGKHMVGILLDCFLVTSRNEVVAKVVFTRVCDSVNRGGICLSACWDTTPLGADSSIGSMSGRYACYWNAFLFGQTFCYRPQGKVMFSQASVS